MKIKKNLKENCKRNIFFLSLKIKNITLRIILLFLKEVYLILNQCS